MIRNPFFPALFAFLFGSLFSFASAALEGEWERLDGGARLRLKIDGAGRLHGTLTNRRPLTASPEPARSGARPPSSPRLLPALRPWRSHDRNGRTLYDSASRRHRLGSIHLASRDRLRFRARHSGNSSEWRRLS